MRCTVRISAEPSRPRIGMYKVDPTSLASNSPSRRAVSLGGLWACLIFPRNFPPLSPDNLPCFVAAPEFKVSVVFQHLSSPRCFPCQPEIYHAKSSGIDSEASAGAGSESGLPVWRGPNPILHLHFGSCQFVVITHRPAASS